MEISSILESETLQNIGSFNSKENESSILCRVAKLREKLQPMMSRPDGGDIHGDIGADGERGPYVEAGFTVYWDSKETQSSPEQDQTSNENGSDR